MSRWGVYGLLICAFNTMAVAQSEMSDATRLVHPSVVELPPTESPPRLANVNPQQLPVPLSFRIAEENSSPVQEQAVLRPPSAVAHASYESTGGAKPGALRLSRPAALPSSTRPKRDSLISAVSALAIVLGLFLGLVWFSRRWGNRRVGELPAALVQTLGRYQISPRNEVCVVRFGSKLLALSITNHATETLAVLDNPEEVAMLSELCQTPVGRQMPRSVRDAIEEYSQNRSEPSSSFAAPPFASPVTSNSGIHS